MPENVNEAVRPRKYVYFGHHRCASLWISSIVGAACSELDLKFSHSSTYGELPEDVNGSDFISHINADMHLVNQLSNYSFKAFHVIRDPRDILTSSYFSDRYSHPIYSEDLADFRKLLNSVSKESGLHMELDRREKQFESMASWNYRNPLIYETRFEIVTIEPYREFVKVLQFVGLVDSGRPINQIFISAWLLQKKAMKRLSLQREVDQLPAAWIKVILWRNSYQRRAGRKRGIVNEHHHYRKGIHGDWQNHFDDRLKRRFKREWGDLLIQLGYESDDRW